MSKDRLRSAEAYLAQHRQDAIEAVETVRVHLDVDCWTVGMDAAIEELKNYIKELVKYRDALRTTSLLGAAEFLMDNLEVDERRLGCDGP